MKEVFTAINDRIKTPYYGYALLAFFALNWRAIFVLFVSQGSATERLAAFDSNTSFTQLLVIPLVIGLFISLINPWLKVLFSWIEKIPRQIYANSISDEEHNKLKYQIKLRVERDALEKVEEDKLISRAKRDSEIESIEDESVKQKLKSDIEEVRNSNAHSKAEILDTLTKGEIDLLNICKEQRSGSTIDDGNMIAIGDFLIGDGADGEEMYAKAKGAIESLLSKGLMYYESRMHPVKCKLNSKGWDAIESLRLKE
ncbi:hypothetical protein ACV4QK_03515 [Alteromonas macleodii]